MIRSLIALGLCITCVASAAASPAIEARFFDQLARRAFTQRDYDRAFENFLFAYELAPTPGTLYNIAIAADLAGNDGEAYVYGETYLATGDDDRARRSDAQQRMSKLRRSLALVRATSDPPGATLYVDRRELGAHGRTPRTLVVEPGTHTILVEREGYLDQSLQVTVGRGQEVELAAALQPVLGVLRVRTTPTDAEVSFSRDQMVVASGPSGAAMSLPIGRYEVRVTADGYQTVAREVVVHEGAEETMRVNLPEVLVRSGRLLVRTADTRATVLVDGRRRGLTPLVLERLPVGRHVVRVSAPSFSVVERAIEIREGRSVVLELELAREVE